MLMKNNQVVPEVLAEQLSKDDFAHLTFRKMRPSCQQLYADKIRMAREPEKRVETVMRAIRDYGKRHGY